MEDTTETQHEFDYSDHLTVVDREIYIPGAGIAKHPITIVSCDECDQTWVTRFDHKELYDEVWSPFDATVIQHFRDIHGIIDTGD